jgi:ribosomal protein S18 acetylase RimI-like enzyme
MDAERRVTIERAEREDAEVILDLQKAAYGSEALLYDDATIPPLIQTIEEMRADFERQLFLKAVSGGEIVGSVRAYMEGGTCYIGRLVVRPDCQNMGIGVRLMEEIESRFAEAERFELFTGHRSEKPLHIYEKRGFVTFRKEPVHDRLTLVYLEKVRA